MYIQSIVTAYNAIQTGQPKGKHLLSVLRSMPQAQALLKMPISDLMGEQWSGQSLEGRSIQVFADQGMGDLIQMFRYLNVMKQRWGCRIVLNCYAWFGQFADLLSQHDFIDEFVDTHIKCDYWTNIICIPFILNDLEYTFPPKFSLLLDTTIPPAPEFRASKILGLPGDHKIGLAWRSNVQNNLSAKKSLDVGRLKPLSGHGTCYSLLPDIEVPDWLQNPEINDLQDTANIIAEMDEVYSVDTCVLHLSGSMKKKTTGLLCNNHDPRWNKNIWYDNMTLTKIYPEQQAVIPI